MEWRRISEHEWASGLFTIVRTYPRRTADRRPRLDKPRYALYFKGQDTGRFGPTLDYAKHAAESM